MITYLETNENDIDEIELLYRKHLDNGTALRARLERVCRDPETLSLKAVDSETGKIVGVIMYTPGISFSCSYPRIVKKVENLAGNIPVYTGEAIFVEDEYRNRHIARNFEIKIREKIANIAKAKGTNIYVLHEMWVYPNGKTPAYGLVSTVFNICHDFGVIPRFYRDYFKNESLCPICGENCVCSARITISEIGSETDPVN